MKRWSLQLLSPIGKITIIKTLIISILSHLFLALPSTRMALGKDFNCKMFPLYETTNQTKLDRDVLSQPHCLGGLKMLNLEMYIKDLKLGLEEFLKEVIKLLSYCLAQRILILQI